MDFVKVSWSGGKDSTCALDLHLEAGHKVKAVCYIPMFTDTIPLILKEHYEFIMRTAQYFRAKGAEIHFAKGITYYDHVKKRITRGKNKGKPFGFPLFKVCICNFKRDSKLKALKEFDVGYFDYEDIGIAADETTRHNQLNKQIRSILVERGITEDMAVQYTKDRYIYSPHYKRNKRDGCTLCPHAPESEREQWFRDYPEAIPLVIELQDFVKCERPEQTPLRGYRWFIEG